MWINNWYGYEKMHAFNLILSKSQLVIKPLSLCRYFRKQHDILRISVEFR